MNVLSTFLLIFVKLLWTIHLFLFDLLETYERFLSYFDVVVDQKMYWNLVKETLKKLCQMMLHRWIDWKRLLTQETTFVLRYYFRFHHSHVARFPVEATCEEEDDDWVSSHPSPTTSIEPYLPSTSSVPVRLKRDAMSSLIPKSD